ncbi:MAG: oligosaccharide flippase family protein [Candidatus Omnitrophota bacterium]
MKHQKLLKDSSIYTLRVIVANATSVLQVIFIARLLGPQLFGMLQVYRIILGFTAYATFGSLWAMMREIAFYRGEKNYQKVEEIKNISFTLNIITSLIATVIMAALIIFYHKISSISMYEMTILVGIVILQQFFSFFDKYLLAEKNFLLNGKASISFQLTNFFGILVLGYFYGLTGVLIAMLFSYALSIIYIVITIHFKFRLSFNIQKSLKLIKIGFPIFGNGLLRQGMASVDRLMIVNFLGKIELGYYGIAGMIKQFMGEFYIAIFTTIFPSLAEKYGETKDIKSVKNYILKPMVVSAHLTPLFIGSIIICLSPFITYILPKYVPGISATSIAITSSYFACLQAGIPNFFIAINKTSRMYPFQIAAIIISLIVTYIAIKLGFGLIGVACSAVISYFVFVTALINYFLQHYSLGLNSRIKFFAYVYYPFGYMVASIMIINFIFRINSYSFIEDLLITSGKLLIFILLNIPLLIYINKKTAVLGEIKKFSLNMLKNKLQQTSEVDIIED